jgi:hypothetical protein
MKAYTLLVWEEIPEKLSFYLIPSESMTDDIVTHMNMAHGKYINADTMNSGMQWLMEVIYTEGPNDVPHRGWLQQFKVSTDEPLTPSHPIKLVYMSGFIL